MKSKQTKAHEISRKVKERVYERQHGKSLFPPYKKITVEMCCCHYLSRAKGGLGKEWNVFGCFQAPWLDEHKMFDRQIKCSIESRGKILSADELDSIVSDHLNMNYEDWSIEKCKYNKYVEYELRRTNDTTGYDIESY